MDINTSVIGVMFLITMVSSMCGYYFRKCTVEAGNGLTLIFIGYLLAIIGFNGYHIIMNNVVK